MNSVPIPPPTDKDKRISEDHKQIMTLIEVVINSIELKNNQLCIYNLCFFVTLTYSIITGLYFSKSSDVK